jgi:hypothetical protein
MQEGVGGAILGGWQISTIVSKSSGFPRTVYSGTDRSNTGGGQDRPDVVAGQDPVLPGGQETIARWFNTNAYTLNALGTFGNAGRNTFFGPGITNFDASIIRNFRMGNKTIQFRLEAFNVLNNPIWNDPNTTISSGALYGTINSTRKPMREVQLGLKFVF